MARLPYDPTAPRGDEDAPQPADELGSGAPATLPPHEPDFDFGAGVPPPFRLDSASVARIPLPAEPAAPIPATYVPSPYPRDRIPLHVGLFLATLATATLVGAGHYASFASNFGAVPVKLGWMLLAHGLWYSGTILSILGAHEFGHYFACRYYRVNASLPYFIPVPPPVLTGTLGAFIRIRQPIRTKRVLFDIGIAGPLAGFVIAVPALLVGMWMSNVAALPKTFSGLELGEPLLFKLMAGAVWGTVKEGYSLNLHPVAFGAWFGLLATALNLFPIGQLDGGHISYAVFGRASTRITLVAVGLAVVLTFRSTSWLVWTVLMVAMLWVFGPSHPSTVDEHVPLDRRRLVLAVVALLVFVLCFTPAPIQPLDLLQK